MLEAEKRLKHYNALKSSIERADRIILRLQQSTAPGELTAVPIDSIKSGRVINTYEQLIEIQKWTIHRENTVLDMAEIDLALNEICGQSGCEHYRDVLTLWYIDGRNKHAVARAMGYSEHSVPWLYRLKNRALKKFAVALYGIDAL